MPEALEVIPASPALIALKPDLGAVQNTVPRLADLPQPKSEDTPAEPDPALVDAAKSSPARHDVAVLSLGESGEILSARGSCLAVFGWECSSLAGKNIRVLLKGGFENELGQFMERRRAGTKTTETVVLHVTVLRQDGTEFPTSVTTPTWSLGTRSAQASDTSHLGRTLAFRSLANSAEAGASVQASTAPAQDQPHGSNQSSRPATGSFPLCGFDLSKEHPPASQERPVERETSAARLRVEPAARRQKDGEDWFESDAAPSLKLTEANISVPTVQIAPPNRTVTTIRPSSGEMREKFDVQQPADEKANPGTEGLEARLSQKTAELERAKADLGQQKAEREQAESEWRRELDTVAKALGAKLEAASSGRQEREQRSEDELAAMRRERDDLKREMEAEAGKRSEEVSRLEFELRAQLDAAKEAAGYTEAALKEETLRRERFEGLSSSLRHQQTEATKRFEEELARLREERDGLKVRLTGEQTAALESEQQAEGLKSRLTKSAAELERIQVEFERYRAERALAESEWRKRLEAPDSRRREMEVAGAKGQEAEKRYEKDLAILRQERDELKGELEAAQRAVTESKDGHAELESQLRRTVGDLERLKAETDQRHAEQGSKESELRAKMDAATEAAGCANAALREEIGRREGFERLSTSLRLEQIEKEQHYEEELAELRKDRDELRGKLTIEQQAIVESGRRVEEMESSRSRSAAEFDRVKAELEQHLAGQERAESSWQRQLETASAQKAKIEAAWAEATEIKKHLEDDLANLRRERDEVSGKLTTEQLAATESKRRVEELRSHLHQTAAELEKARAESSEQSAERQNSESQWQLDLNAANIRRQKFETALAEAVGHKNALEGEVTDLRQERDELNDRLSGEQRIVAESNRRAEVAERRLNQTADELARVQTELDEQTRERERLESEGQQQLNAARIRKEKIELAWAGATERNKHLEEELAAIRQETDELNGRLAGEHRAAAECARRAEAAERRLIQNTAELERVKAELEKQVGERESVESEWREQLTASKALGRKLEAAWTGAVERSKRAEGELAILRQEVDELGGKLAVEQSTASELRKRADASERRARQYAVELERAKAASEAKAMEPGRARVERHDQPGPASVPTRSMLSGAGAKSAERRNSVAGDSYSPPAILLERYNLQP